MILLDYLKKYLDHSTLKRRCDRCEALIQFNKEGMVFDGYTAEEIYYKECPFCGRENHYWRKLK